MNNSNLHTSVCLQKTTLASARPLHRQTRRGLAAASLGIGVPATFFTGLLIWLTVVTLVHADSPVVTITRLHSFGSPRTDGAIVDGGVTEGNDGVLYGTAALGGASDGGTVFRVNKDGTGFAVLKSFNSEILGFEDDFGQPGEAIYGFPNGRIPDSGVTEGSDSALYGTTVQGGAFGYGTVFRMNKDGTGFAVLKSFGTTGPEGNQPGAA